MHHSSEFWFAAAVAYKFIIRSMLDVQCAHFVHQWSEHRKRSRRNFTINAHTALHKRTSGRRMKSEQKGQKWETHWIEWNWKFRTKWQSRSKENDRGWLDTKWIVFWQINYNETEKDERTWTSWIGIRKSATSTTLLLQYNWIVDGKLDNFDGRRNDKTKTTPTRTDCTNCVR